ncbi:MAG: CBS domain-containing protein [Anaerolineae bacterium]
MADRVQVQTNSERFLTAFGSIERQLRLISGLDKRTRFYTLVDKAAERNAGVRRYADDLKEFADLRNAIVHERTDEHVIAEPNDLAVRLIEHIADLLEHPPGVLPTFAKKVYTMTPEDPISAAAYLMRHHGFSQLPIYDDQGKFRALLTTEDITRWLGECASEETISLQETTIARVMACHCQESGEDYLFFSRKNTFFDVLQAFQESERKGCQLVAILITENGHPDESLLGIITIWDLPQIYETLDQRR